MHDPQHIYKHTHTQKRKKLLPSKFQWPLVCCKREKEYYMYFKLYWMHMKNHWKHTKHDILLKAAKIIALIWLNHQFISTCWFSMILSLKEKRERISLKKSYLQTVVVSLAPIVSTVGISETAVIQWTITHEPILQRVISFLVPFKMTYHLFFLWKYLY